MLGILKRQKGMNIVGQGGKIILFMLPSLIAAILVQRHLPRSAALPSGLVWLKPIGYALLVAGLVFWGTAVIQLVRGFPRWKLVTKGAYGIVRNPIYASATFFIFPGIALATLSWVYFVPAIFLFAGAQIFIRKEEIQLTQAFGREYEEYLARVDRLIPFRKPR